MDKATRKYWRQQNNVKESKRNIVVIIFWVCLMLYTITQFTYSTLDLFVDKAKATVEVEKGTFVDVVFDFQTWNYSIGNKVIKMFLHTIFLAYGTWISYSFIKNKIEPSQAKLYVILSIVSLIYAASNLPSVKEYNQQTRPSTIAIIALHNHFGSAGSPDMSLWTDAGASKHITMNFMCMYLSHEFIIKLVTLSVIGGAAVLSLVIIYSSSGMDKVFV